MIQDTTGEENQTNQIDSLFQEHDGIVQEPALPTGHVRSPSFIDELMISKASIPAPVSSLKPLPTLQSSEGALTNMFWRLWV